MRFTHPGFCDVCGKACGGKGHDLCAKKHKEAHKPKYSEAERLKNGRAAAKRYASGKVKFPA